MASHPRRCRVQTPPCSILHPTPCGDDGFGKLTVLNADKRVSLCLEKKVPLELVDTDSVVTIGASHGWVATLKHQDGILRLQDDLNPAASDTNPKRILLPPLVTMPHCQTQIITNVSMSSSSPEENDCIVAVKFLGPQLSFCRPASFCPEWTNFRIENPCFHSSRVMFSKSEEDFCMPGSGGRLIGSWHPYDKPKFQRLRFRNLPEQSKTEREMLLSCSTSEHLVESLPTNETFLVKWFRKATNNDSGGVGPVKMRTRAVMVFKIDEEGNKAVYTKDIGDLTIFLSDSEPFCVPASSFPGMHANTVEIYVSDECASVSLDDSTITSQNHTCSLPYHIPPQQCLG